MKQPSIATCMGLSHVGKLALSIYGGKEIQDVQGGRWKLSVCSQVHDTELILRNTMKDEE